MAAPNLEELFDDSRFLTYDWTLLLLILYTPIGLILVLARVFLLLQFYLVFVYLPYSSLRKFILQIFGSVLGVVINEKHKVPKISVPETCLWMANHVSPFDRIVLQVLCSEWKSISFPECSITNGKRGLLKFQSRVFEQQKRNNPDLKIQPVVLNVSRSFPALSVSLVDSSLWSDTFFLLFSPCTVFNIRFLEPIACLENESLEVYVSRLERIISESLGIPVTSYTYKDKDELMKRKKADTQFNQTALRRPVGSNLEAMAAQVKEILPHVPLAVIIRDLGRTNNIDATVANIVEGVVPFVPEPVKSVEITPSAVPPTSVPASTSSSSTSGGMQVQISASTFGKSAQERGLSLQERKQRLLQEARRRYCEKHGLNLADFTC